MIDRDIDAPLDVAHPRVSRPLVFVVKGDITVVESGARKRFQEAFSFLRANCADVTVYSVYEDNNRPWDEQSVTRFHVSFPGIRLVLDRRTLPHRLLTRLKQMILMLAPGLAHPLITLSLPFICPRYRALKRSLSAPAMFFCGVDNLIDLNGLPDEASVIIDTLDLKFVHYAMAMSQPIFGLKVVARMRMEMALLGACNLSIAISRAEASTIRMFHPGRDCLVIPAFPSRPGIAKTSVPDYQYDLLFVGTGYHFNVKGVLDFIRQNRSWIGRFRIALAGKVCQDREVASVAASFPNIKLLGFVDDLASLYRETRLAVSSVDGTGLKIKILEALTNGTPVLASASSIEGLPDGYRECVFPIEEAVATTLLRDDDALAKAQSAVPIYLRAFAAEEEKALLRRAIDRMQPRMNRPAESVLPS